MSWKQSSLKNAFKLRALSPTGIIFRYQRYWLRLFGFAPFNLSAEAALAPILNPNYILSIIALLLVAGSLLSFTMNTSTLVKTCFLGKSTKYNPIVQAISYLPYSLVNLRAAIPLFMLIRTRRSYPQLRNAADEIIALCFPDDLRRNRHIRRWTRVALGLGILTLCGSLLWETLSWLDWFERNPGYLSPEHVVQWYPFPFSIHSGPTIAFWALSQGLVFYLSQQIFIIGIVYGVILNSCLGTVRESARDALRYVAHAEALGNKVEFAPLFERLRRFRTVHTATYDFCEKVNGCFGWMVFFFYGLDVVTLCGFVALLMVPSDEDRIAYQYAFGACGTVLFLIYSTVFLMPLVRLYEEGHRFTSDLVKLYSAVQLQDGSESETFQKRLKSLILTRKDQTVGLNAGGLFYVSRHLLGATFTFVVSSALMCYELLETFEHRTSTPANKPATGCSCRNITCPVR